MLLPIARTCVRLEEPSPSTSDDPRTVPMRSASETAHEGYPEGATVPASGLRAAITQQDAVEINENARVRRGNRRQPGGTNLATVEITCGSP
jgi:hypothetical protein